MHIVMILLPCKALACVGKAGTLQILSGKAAKTIWSFLDRRLCDLLVLSFKAKIDL